MSGFILFVLLCVMAAVVVVLVMGLYTMAKGDDFTGKKSNTLMWRRVLFQGIALALFALLLITR